MYCLSGRLKTISGCQVTGEEGRKGLNTSPGSCQEADHLLAQRLDCERPLTTHLQLVPLPSVGHEKLFSGRHASGQLRRGQAGPKRLKHPGRGLQCQGKVFDGLEGQTIIVMRRDQHLPTCFLSGRTVELATEYLQGAMHHTWCYTFAYHLNDPE